MGEEMDNARPFARRGCSVVAASPVMLEHLESRQLMSVAVTRLELVNADTGKDILALKTGITLNLATLPTKHLNVRADVGTGTLSVKFGLDANASYRTESSLPLALAGDDGKGHYYAW